jgi:hypothetical protein
MTALAHVISLRAVLRRWHSCRGIGVGRHTRRQPERGPAFFLLALRESAAGLGGDSEKVPRAVSRRKCRGRRLRKSAAALGGDRTRRKCRWRQLRESAARGPATRRKCRGRRLRESAAGGVSERVPREATRRKCRGRRLRLGESAARGKCRGRRLGESAVLFLRPSLSGSESVCPNLSSESVKPEASRLPAAVPLAGNFWPRQIQVRMPLWTGDSDIRSYCHGSKLNLNG